MHSKTTDWMSIPGSYERRAVVTGPNADLAAFVYGEMTTNGMSLDRKIERGIVIHRLGNSYTHEYRLKETVAA